MPPRPPAPPGPRRPGPGRRGGLAERAAAAVAAEARRGAAAAAEAAAARPAARAAALDGRPGRGDGPAVRGGGGVERVGGRPGQRDQQPGPGDGRGHPPAAAPGPAGGGRPCQGTAAIRAATASPPSSTSGASLGVPVGRAPQQHPRPDGGHGHGPGQPPAGHRAPAHLPQAGGAHADQRADGRGQGDGVVGVEDALHEAEDHAGDDQPPAPEGERGPGPVGPRRPPGQPQPGGQQQQGGREQPGDLAADLGPEHAGPAGLAPAAARAAADAAGLVAGEPAEAVVAEGQLEDAVGLGAADVRPGRRRQQLHDRDPPAGRGHHRRPGGGQLAEPAAQRPGGRGQVDEGEGGDDQQRLELLGQEAEPTQAPARTSQRVAPSSSARTTA